MSAVFQLARSKVNFRLIFFLAAVSAPFLWIAYAGARQMLNGGIQDKGSYKLVDLKALGNFNFDKEAGDINDVPKRFRQLDGQRVALEGFMWADTAGHWGMPVKEFQFVYNVSKCCFNGPPQVQERVFGYCAKGKSIPLAASDRYVRMFGTLHVEVKKQEGAIQSVYTLDVEHVEAM